MQITALTRVTQCHVPLLDDIDCAVLSILRCPMSSSALLWLCVSMTFSASLSSWLGLLRVSENGQQYFTPVSTVNFGTLLQWQTNLKQRSCYNTDVTREIFNAEVKGKNSEIIFIVSYFA